MFSGLGYLQISNAGEEVADLQAKLSRVGLIVPVTGTFDAGTQAAVREFQRSQNIPADGVIDDKTYQALVNILSKKPNETTSTPSMIMMVGLGIAAGIVGLLLLKRG